ncbi:MAG: hypothetical protein DGJ47_000906 [Rickettsiaceae bacterium]
MFTKQNNEVWSRDTTSFNKEKAIEKISSTLFEHISIGTSIFAEELVYDDSNLQKEMLESCLQLFGSVTERQKNRITYMVEYAQYCVKKEGELPVTSNELKYLQESISSFATRNAKYYQGYQDQEDSYEDMMGCIGEMEL